MKIKIRIEGDGVFGRGILEKRENEALLDPMFLSFEEFMGFFSGQCHHRFC